MGILWAAAALAASSMEPVVGRPLTALVATVGDWGLGGALGDVLVDAFATDFLANCNETLPGRRYTGKRL